MACQLHVKIASLLWMKNSGPTDLNIQWTIPSLLEESMKRLKFNETLSLIYIWCGNTVSGAKMFYSKVTENYKINILKRKM